MTSSKTTPTPSAGLLQQTRQLLHPHCFAGKPVADGGLGAKFTLQSDGALRGLFPCDARFEGYPGIIHGGVVSTVLDAAMTNFLFARGIHAMTGELNIRFHKSVISGQPAIVVATLKSCRGPLYQLQAELRQHGKIKVTATAKFMESQSSES